MPFTCSLLCSSFFGVAMLCFLCDRKATSENSLGQRCSAAAPRCYWSYWSFNEQSTAATPVGCPWTQPLDGHRCGSRRASRGPLHAQLESRTGAQRVWPHSYQGKSRPNLSGVPLPGRGVAHVCSSGAATSALGDTKVYEP